jgi:FlaA1/EpsC-like NDP-sugar epimerase
VPRYLNKSLQIVLDAGVLSAAYWLAFLFRFEFRLPSAWLTVVLITWPYIVALQYGALLALGVPSLSWRYVGIRDALRILGALAVATGVFVIVRIGFRDVGEHLDFLLIPLGVLGMNFILAVGGLVGLRATRRLYGESQERQRRDSGGQRHRVLLIGAGQAGVLVAREISSRPDLGLDPVGFLDDDIHKQGTRISGLAVLGTTAQLAAIAAKKRVHRVLITIANAPGHQIRRITMACHAAGLDTKIIPGIYEIVGDRVNLSRIRQVAIEDLLGRAPVQLDEVSVSSSVQGKVAMVTGAGGSIGSELCRQLCRFSPSRLLLVERAENALFEIHRELLAAFPEVTIEPVVADVCDQPRMEQLFARFSPAVVFHAAAHKHVPMMEWNPGEAVKNNVLGTRTVAQLADRHRVAQFVLVSTDKAVNPTSTMGATKRCAEIYVQALSQRSSTRFVTVRFGNVLGSAGSVIPIFKEQIARGGPVTITHPDMRRYFMTISEAAQLVVQAGAMGHGGEIFILDMGQPVKIVDLARDLITLSGFRPDDDIEIAFTGIRPGEKLFEELSTDNEHAEKTKHPKIFIGRIRAHQWEQVERDLAPLAELANSRDENSIRRALAAIVPEYQPEASPPAMTESSTSEAPPLADLALTRTSKNSTAEIAIAGASVS